MTTKNRSSAFQAMIDCTPSKNPGSAYAVEYYTIDNAGDGDQPGDAVH